MDPALFLDRDGVLNPLVETSGGKISPQSVAEFEFYPWAEKALQRAKENGFQVIVFTNQPDVEKKWRGLDRQRLERINQVLRDAGVDTVYSCTHGPLGEEGNKHYRENGEIAVCDCRKPQPGLIEQAAEDHDIEFEESYLIGDNREDIEAGERFENQDGVSFAGKYSIGRELEKADRRFDNLNVAIEFIVGE